MTHSDIPVVPFVVRGNIYREGNLLFDNGRIQFRYPDPRKIPDLLLADGVQLRRDFADIKTSEVIRFLGEAGKLMNLDNPAFQQAFEFSQQYSALTPSVLRGSFDLIKKAFSPFALVAMAENEIGSAYLDGWVNVPYAEKRSRIRAYGMRTLHYISGNVPVVAALSIIRAALIKADNVLKVAITDPFTAQAILKAFAEVDPKHPVTRHFAAVYWPADMPDFDSKVVSANNFEKIISWGGAMGGANSAMSHAELNAAGVDIIQLGAKFSVVMLGKEAFRSPAEIDFVAKRVAKDTFSFNQQSCGSTRYHFVEAGPGEVRQYADALKKYMFEQDPALSTPAPRSITAEMREAVDALRFDDENYYVTGGENGSGAIVASLLTGEPAEIYPVDNHVSIVRVERLEDAVPLISSSVQTVAIYPEHRKDDLRDLLVAQGAARFISIGHTIDFTVGAPFNHTEIMRRACRWVLDESYPNSKLDWVAFGLSKISDIAKHHLLR